MNSINSSVAIRILLPTDPGRGIYISELGGSGQFVLAYEITG